MRYSGPAELVHDDGTQVAAVIVDLWHRPASSSRLGSWGGQFTLTGDVHGRPVDAAALRFPNGATGSVVVTRFSTPNSSGELKGSGPPPLTDF